MAETLFDLACEFNTLIPGLLCKTGDGKAYQFVYIERSALNAYLLGL